VGRARKKRVTGKKNRGGKEKKELERITSWRGPVPNPGKQGENGVGKG